MAETKEERRARIAREVAAASAARKEAYFETQAKSKAAAEAATPELPAPDAYTYSYAWRQDVGAPTGQYNLIKNPNPYYDASTNTIVNPATGERTDATQSMWSGPTSFRGDVTAVTGSDVKDPVTGLTPAQKEAADALAKAKADAASLAAALGAKVDPATGKIVTSTIDPNKAAEWYATQPQSGTITKTGKTEVKRVTNPDGSITITYSDGTTSTIPARVVTGSGNGFSGSSATGFSSSGAPTGPTLAKDVFKQTLALFFGEAELTKGWMDELYNVVSKYYRNGVAVAEALNMSLLDARNNPNLKAFTDRFKGIYALQDLRQSGKPVSVPTIAEYVAAQKGMADIFTEAGLGDIATEQFTGELIGKGNSVSTVADKIGNVYQRIDMAPKEIKDVFSRYFPTVDRTTLAKTILLGEKGVAQLVDELNKYDVLAAAEQQGVGALGAKGIVGGVTEDRAQNYARLGYSYSELLPKFAQVREVTPTVGKLAGISKAADIGQVGVEQALISGLAQPMETIKKLGEEEIGRFSGKAGRAELGLASQRRANRAF
jgi:hypothetical protein